MIVRAENHRRVAALTVVITSAVLLADPVVAQEPDGFTLPSSRPDPPDGFGGFVALVVVFAIVGVLSAAWRFGRVRDMARNRGMSERDATTAALFGTDNVVTGMVLADAILSLIHI